jgi:hypothetical protein
MPVRKLVVLATLLALAAGLAAGWGACWTWKVRLPAEREQAERERIAAEMNARLREGEVVSASKDSFAMRVLRSADQSLVGKIEEVRVPGDAVLQEGNRAVRPASLADFLKPGDRVLAVVDGGAARAVVKPPAGRGAPPGAAEQR